MLHDQSSCIAFKVIIEWFTSFFSAMAGRDVSRLTKRTPLMTILVLMIGPLCSQLTSTLYGIINTIWISKYVGEVGMAAVATDIAWEGVARAFGLFLSIAGSSQISALFGQEKFEECNQVACDLYRVSIILGLIVPAILIPINKPFSRWFKANEETVDMAFWYIIPQAAGNVFTCIFFTNVGFLQAEGRTLLVGIIDIISLGVGMGVLNPIFLAVLKTGVIGPSISTIIADAVPGIVLTILFFKGKFVVKPTLKGLISPFSKATFQALTVGSSQLIALVSTLVPGIILRRLIGLSLPNKDEYSQAMAAFNVVCRYGSLVIAIVMAFCTGFLPAAAYAYAAGMWKRYLALAIHLNWINFVWCLITTTLVFSIPYQIGRIFGKGEVFLDWCKRELIAANWGNFIFFGRYTFQSMLQSQQRGKRAMIISFTSNFVVSIAACYILYYTDKHKAERLMWSFSISCVFGFVFGLALLAKPLYEIYKKYKDANLDDQKDPNNQNDAEKQSTSEIETKTDSTTKESEKESKEAVPNEAEHENSDSAINV